MSKLRAILAGNIKAYRTDMGLSQLKLAEMADTAPNYIAMIEAEKRFPTDTMLERIAAALRREPFELISIAPVQKQWQASLLAELAEFITIKLKDAQRESACEPPPSLPSKK
ncbi:MAG: helix-turn-helix domain-containing protein [Spirochaetaceae bacterium]|jgi:transcriptional regulator with XRE-family HTH domain|nr:helix-turn-helix domain-containing protein [Spirochaetaceae bacterium]